MDSGLRHNGWLTVTPGEVLRLQDAAGRHLSVVRGVVWITQHGDRRDPVLEAGASFRFERDGLSLVQALGGPAIVALEDGLVPEDVTPPDAEALAPQPRRLARSKRVGRNARRMRTQTLASLSDHLLRDLGLRRDRVDFGAHTPECTHC